MKQELWAAPLLLLPGVALLIMSTSVRYSRLHDEIHRIAGNGKKACRSIQLLFRRGKLLHFALVALYVSVAFLAFSSFIGGIFELSGRDGSSAVFVTTCLGITTLVFAAVVLIMESLKALDIIRDHIEEYEMDPP